MTDFMKSNISSLKEIHNKVFDKINEYYVNVFLCGGASSNQWKSTRDEVREGLKNIKNIRILYPEELFIEMLNKDKFSNMLSLEEFLADNSDIICIICESPGSLVELGAFTNNKNTFRKVIAVIDEKYRRHKSFIMLGPIKLIASSNKENVLFYKESEIKDLVHRLSKLFSSRRLKKITGEKEKKKYSIQTLIGLYYFIPLMIYFYNSIMLKDIEIMLKSLYEDLEYDTDKFDRKYKSAIRLLYKEKLIKKVSNDSGIMYKLTPKGYDNVIELMDRAIVSNKEKLYNQIRFSIMKKQYY